jgi:branched-chain amino acid transport system substrate-binding protein
VVLGLLGLLAGLVSCGEPEPLVIGALVPETGSASTYAESMRHGIELAVEQVNAGGPGQAPAAEGGVLGGRPVVVEFRDTGTSPETGAAALIDLVETHKLWGVVGPISSSVALRIAPIAADAEVPLVSPAASAPRLTEEGGPWFFRNYPSDLVEGGAMAEFARQLALSSVAIVAVDDVFGEGISEVFVERYEAPTRQVVLHEMFEADLTDEAALELAREVADADAEAVYIAAYQGDVAQILMALDEIDTKVARLGTSAVTREIVELAGESADGLVFPQAAFQPEDANTEQARAFVAAYQERYGGLPDNYAAHAYDATRVLLKAVDNARIRKEVLGALRTIAWNGATGRIDFDLNGDVVQPSRMYAVLAGEVVPYEEFRDAMVGRSILAR